MATFDNIRLPLTLGFGVFHRGSFSPNDAGLKLLVIDIGQIRRLLGNCST